MSNSNQVDLSADLSELEWIQLMADIDEARPRQEETWDKMKRKFAEKPLIPIGCLATAGMLLGGLISLKKGKSRHQQLFMRGRIAAQGFTLAVIFVGLYKNTFPTPEVTPALAVPEN